MWDEDVNWKIDAKTPENVMVELFWLTFVLWGSWGCLAWMILNSIILQLHWSHIMHAEPLRMCYLVFIMIITEQQKPGQECLPTLHADLPHSCPHFWAISLGQRQVFLYLKADVYRTDYGHCYRCNAVLWFDGSNGHCSSQCYEVYVRTTPTFLSLREVTHYGMSMFFDKLWQ